jgi:hypothetical protein
MEHDYYEEINNLILNLGCFPKSRELSLVITKLEEALLWLKRRDEIEQQLLVKE